MGSEAVERALQARTRREIDAAEGALSLSSDPEAPYAGEQLQMMRLALEEGRIQKAIAELLGEGDLP